jgi:hypothetical protein
MPLGLAILGILKIPQIAKQTLLSLFDHLFGYIAASDAAEKRGPRFDRLATRSGQTMKEIPFEPLQLAFQYINPFEKGRLIR